jgi:hypothetical protein
MLDDIIMANDRCSPIACENLVGFSIAQPSIFKRHQLLPVRDLKLLVRDYRVSIYILIYILYFVCIRFLRQRLIVSYLPHVPWQPIAKNALTILINLSADVEVLESLAEDNAFLETLLARVTVSSLTFFLQKPNVSSISSPLFL